MDGQTVVVLVLASGLAGVLVGLGSVWRELRLALRELPVHVALRRFDVQLAPEPLRNAEARCIPCVLRQSCLRGLVRYEPIPSECPNVTLFAPSPGRSPMP